MACRREAAGRSFHGRHTTRHSLEKNPPLHCGVRDFLLQRAGVRAGERPEIQFREEGSPQPPGGAGTSLENHGAQFNPDAFFQSKTPALTDSAANLDAPQVGRAADAQMFFFFILAICVVGFLGLVVFRDAEKECRWDGSPPQWSGRGGFSPGVARKTPPSTQSFFASRGSIDPGANVAAPRQDLQRT